MPTTKAQVEKELSKTKNKLLWESNRRRNVLTSLGSLRRWAVESHLPGDMRTELVSKIDEIINRS
jgi:hypothetical protein